MKKVFTFILTALFSIALFAQDGKSDMKNFRFGVTALPSLTWYKPDDLKKFEKRGTAFRFGVLINGELSFSGNFAVGFGIGLGSCGGKINFLDSTHYYVNDGDIIPLKNDIPDTSGLTGKIDHYLLKTRTYKANYYTIPISLKMRTNEIGYMRYFFEPRFNIGIRNKVRADDDYANWGSTNVTKNEDVDITDDMARVRLSATLSAGGEYYLSGSTAFVFAIGYDYGLTNVAQNINGNTSDNLLRTKDNIIKPLEQKFTQGGIILSVGILF